MIALLTAAVANPRALETLRDRYRSWQDRLDHDGVPVPVATAIRFAVDGIWLADALDLAPATGRRRKETIAALRQMLDNA